MKTRITRVLNLILLIVLCAACSPAPTPGSGGGNTKSSSLYTVIICIVILGLLVAGTMVVVRLVISQRKKNSPKENLSRTKSNAVENNIKGDNDIKVEAVKQQVQEYNSSLIPVLVTKTTDGLDTSLDNRLNTRNIGDIQGNQIISIKFEPDETKSQAASEIVDVPLGVQIKVKRIRTIEHTLSIEWLNTLTGKGEVGIKQLVATSIQGEIQRIKGNISQQTESTEYEITLDGIKCNQYKLIWMDVWLKGFAEIKKGNETYSQPFQFRDRTELKVLPITPSES